MIEEKNDNFYTFDEENDIDDSPRNFAQPDNYDLGDEDEDDEPKSSKNGFSCFMLLMRVMLNPVEGWKAVRRRKVSAEQMQSDCFYPLLAILAACKFVILFYVPNTNISSIIVQAVIAFVSYFFGYFCVIMTMKMVTPKKVGKFFDTNFGKVYVIIAISTLCLFSIFMEILPMLWPILIFLPIWTIYIIIRGLRFIKLPAEGVNKFAVMLCVAIIGIPILIDWALTAILPA